MGIVTNDNYDIANAQNNKEPIIVLEIEGAPFVIGSETIYTLIRYDDPDVYYDGTYVYDGLRPLAPDKQKRLIDRKGSSSTISQKLEQWDGKASVQTMNMKIVDYNKIITKLCSPGQVLEDIINRKVRILQGFKNISYPEDYIVLFKGYINNVKIAEGNVQFTFTDPSSKRKQVLFNSTILRTTALINPGDTTINLSSTSNIYRTILNAKGIADPGVTIGLVIDDSEIVTYTNAGIISGTQLQVTRGQFGTTAIAHDPDVEVKCFISLSDNPLNIALKTMLSGWNGPWVSNIPLRGIVNTDDGFTVANSLTFNQGVNVERDYGVVLGDFAIILNAVNPSNNGTFTISNIINDGRTILINDGTLIQENPDSPATVGFRSKYDVYPETAGLSLTTDDVLVSAFEYNRDTFVNINFQMDIIAEEKSGKQWIEQHLFKPIGGYSLTQGSKISCGVTHPPLANDLTKFIEPKNVIDTKSIVVERGLDTRFFYNEIYFQYKYNALNDAFYRSLRIIDADAQKRTRQVSVLELDCRGLPDNQTSIDFMTSRAKRLLQRYKFAAETVEVKTFYGVGHTIDAGDTVVLNDTDPATLQIANTEQGGRGITNRIMEVQERTIEVSAGQTRLKLLSNNGYSFSDRYGVVGPASYIDETFANTTTKIKIKDSFSVMFPGAEYKKWENYEGSTIRVHNANYTNDAETVFHLDVFDNYIFNITPALPFVPGLGDVVEFSKYNDTNANINGIVKSTFVHLNSTATIFSGSSNTVFTLDSGYSVRYKIGMIVYVMSPDGVRYSEDVKIVNLVGDVVTIGPIFTGGSNPDLGFIPQPGDLMQLAGFKDGGAGFRLI